VLHAATLPDPGALVRRIEELAEKGLPAAPQTGSADSAPTPVASADWERLIEAVDKSGALRVAQVMRDWVRVIELAPGRLTYTLAPGLGEDPAPELRDALLKATGERWQVEAGAGEAMPTLRERAEAEQADRQARIRKSPLVEAAFAAFPEAELVEEAETGAGSRNWSKRA
jgi:DNA polymerase-3 subunit gamma/tau